MPKKETVKVDGTEAAIISHKQDGYILLTIWHVIVMKKTLHKLLVFGCALIQRFPILVFGRKSITLVLNPTFMRSLKFNQLSRPSGCRRKNG
ncbi:MAG: hypothetical protein LBR68_01635 [Lachnoclostridium sp.]|nr:hypothetical protein [Lachnoclostridium sp.]